MEKLSGRREGNFDYLVDVIDWDKNIDPDFSKNRFYGTGCDNGK